MSRSTYRVNAQFKGVRVDKYISECLRLSRRYAQKLIKEGKVSVGRKIVSSDYRLQEKEEVEVNYIPSEGLSPYEYEVPILYEDEAIIVVNKPAHLSVHPAGGEKDTLVNALIYMGKTLAGSSSLRPGIVHRLDKETSGVMVVAKTLDAYEDLVEQFRRRRVKKEYRALVEGRVREEKMSISLPLQRDHKNFRIKVGFLHARSSLTEVERKEVFRDASLLLVRPLSGRMHQIRVHLSFFGHPIIGDVKYKGRPAERLYLHAERIEFRHPLSGKQMSFKAELPEEFMVKIGRLREQ